MPDRLIRPASGGFILASLLLALLLALMPVGRVPWAPDPLALVLVFWAVHAPRRVGLGVAFIFGLALDVHQAALLGQHALAYAVLVYGAIMLHRRVRWFASLSQALHLLPLFAAAHLIVLALRMLGGAPFPGWQALAAPLIEAVLWPFVGALLQAPQRRAAGAGVGVGRKR